ncbi:hypothetical protein [Caminibacter sp.]
MNISEVKEVFLRFDECRSKWNKERGNFQCKDTINNISKDDSNNVSLCKFENKFFAFDYIAKEFGIDISSNDMIFFDTDNNKIVFVEFKNGKIKSDKKPKIIKKFLDSFYLLNKILELKDKNVWKLNTCLVFVTSKEKNKNQFNDKKNYSEEMISYLENNQIYYGFERYKGWFFNEIYTPLCNDFKEFMLEKFNIQLIEGE